MNNLTYFPGDILKETTEEIRKILGNTLYRIKIEKIILGLFFTGVKLNNGIGGICFTPIKTISDNACYPSAAEYMPHSGRLKNISAVQILKDMWSGNALRKSIGIALINALSTLCWNKISYQNYSNSYVIRRDVNALDEITVNDRGFAVVVGANIPVFKTLKKHKIPYRILELYPSSLEEEGLKLSINPKYAKKIIPEADLLIITGKTLINDTLEYYLKFKKPDADIIVIGPTSSMLPGAFFRRGVNTLGGIIVRDTDRVLDVIAEAGSGYHFFGKGVEKVVIDKLSKLSKKKKKEIGFNSNIITRECI